MIRTLTPTHPRKFPFGLLFLLLLALSLFALLQVELGRSMPSVLQSTIASAGGLGFTYQVIHEDVEVDWSGGGDFDPKDKCPDDFFREGFTLVCKKLKQGGYFKFLYHRQRKLLYRVDKDLVGDKARIGLHWVEGTSFAARYRIADAAYKGGKTVRVPDGKGNAQPQVFQYGEAVSKKRVQRERELFRETHIQPKQCEEWWDIFNFVP